MSEQRRPPQAAISPTSSSSYISSATDLPLPRHEVRVVDDADHEVGDRQEGRLQFRGPSATRGYLDNPEATEVLHAGDWLETGDLGYIASGEVYVTGRSKDLIIRAGRNLYPDEIEHAIADLDHVRKGWIAVFAVDDPKAATERLIVLAEPDWRTPTPRLGYGTKSQRWSPR